MRAAAFLCAALIAGASPAIGEGRKLLGAHLQDDWSAVGRINLGDGFCSGALVAPDLVVTAAHCLFAPRTGARRLAERVHFVTGYRMRRHEGHSRAAKLTIHPDYTYAKAPIPAQIATDLALIRLEEALAPAPFGLAPGLRPGDEVTILSYGRDRPEIPSIQSPCRATARQGAIVALDCDVTFGVSGAPVFRQVDGTWRIVAVVSAMGELKGKPHAFAVALDEALAPVLAAP